MSVGHKINLHAWLQSGLFIFSSNNLNCLTCCPTLFHIVLAIIKTSYEGCPESFQPFWKSRKPVAWPRCILVASQRRPYCSSVNSHSPVGLVSRQWDAVDWDCVLCDRRLNGRRFLAHCRYQTVPCDTTCCHKCLHLAISSRVCGHQDFSVSVGTDDNLSARKVPWRGSLIRVCSTTFLSEAGRRTYFVHEVSRGGYMFWLIRYRHRCTSDSLLAFFSQMPPANG